MFALNLVRPVLLHKNLLVNFAHGIPLDGIDDL